MALAPGTRLGPYEITGQIGAGGMGEVYRATDTNLGRQVAIKVLPDAVAADPERLARFQREAEVLASLNHPNIAGIYGLEKNDGTTALILELVEGPTLADRIAHGPVPLDEALPIAKQIAEGLEAAHEQGIIHRDLKPANIKLRPDGRVKVLDFGLAKSLEPAVALSQASEAPTVTSPVLTQVGRIMGTIAYMSPEQARGRPADKRSDIWSFGCVLYEALTGRRAVSGHSASEALTQVLDDEPDWRALPGSTPRSIRALLRQCLRKDAQRRMHDIAVARVQLDDAIIYLGRRRSGIQPLRRAAAMMAVLAITSAVWWYPWKSNPSSQPRSELLPHQPVSIVIADLKNRTNESVFDRTLEPMFRRALEGTGFISAYDRSRIRRLLGVAPPDKLDELAARTLFAEQGVNVILSSTLERQGSGYAISVKAVQKVSGDVIANPTAVAPDRDHVISVAIKLTTTIRKALGDDQSESDQMSALASLLATSLDVARLYAVAEMAMSDRKFEEARQSALQAVALDPSFGIGYQQLAVLSLNLRRREDAEKYFNQALIPRA